MGNPEQISGHKFFPRVRAKIRESIADYRDDFVRLRLQRLLRRLEFKGTEQDHHQTIRNIFSDYLKKANAGQDGFRLERDNSTDNRYGLEHILKGYKVMGYRTIDFHPNPGEYETETFVTIETNAGFPDVGLRLFDYPEIDGKQQSPFLEGGFYSNPQTVRYIGSDDPKRSRMVD
jgi:hypothetical protein